MELKELALLLGLDASADESAVKARIATLKKAEEDVNSLRTEKEQMTLSAITQAVDAAVNEKRISAGKKDHFINLGKSVGLDALKDTLAMMAPAAKVSQMLNQKPQDGQASTYEKLSAVPECEIQAMRKDDRETYIKLFKAEYGFEPTFDED